MKKLSVLLLLVAAFTACQPKKDTVRSATNLGLTGLSGSTTNLAGCTAGATTLGAIWDGSATSGSFQSRVISLLSATMTADQIGTVSGTVGDPTGVRFSGTMFLDAAGNVVSSRSNVKVTVYDSIWAINQTTDNEIPLQFNPTQGATLSGQFSTTTGAGFLSMKDSYGEIRFTGTYNNSQFTGTVSFANTANVNGGAGSSGTLGQFTISTCGFIQK